MSRNGLCVRHLYDECDTGCTTNDVRSTLSELVMKARGR